MNLGGSFFAILTTGVLAGALAAGSASAGNGAPSGSHYNLNVIGVPKNKTAAMDGSNRHVIFVQLDKSSELAANKIWLTEGPFKVLDGNATDGNGGAFQLPVSNIDCPVDAAPDDPCQNSGDYAVYIRALGKPGGSADIVTCTVDPSTNETVCSTESVHVQRSTGKSKFTNVTKELTTICVDVDLDPDDVVPCDSREQLFSRDNWLYYWDWDNNGLKLAQLRFYDQP
jgi:hypothetical protein